MLDSYNLSIKCESFRMAISSLGTDDGC